MLKHLSDKEARELLDECCTGRLGCVYNGGPYVVPVNYILHGDNIYVHSLPGRKINALRENPRACLQVDKSESEYHWRSAIAFGHYEEITDESDRQWAIRRVLSRTPGLTPVESVHAVEDQPSVIVFRIRVEKVSGVAEM
jgi:nitroimidazol reductase NimA-like FMN-containing flavoprotein (pyridoxamine 5'-phosphate oxidase superfamily)